MTAIALNSAAFGALAGAAAWLALGPLAVALDDWHRGRAARLDRSTHTAR